MRNLNDRISKWILDQRADSILRLTNLPAIVSWRAVTPEKIALARIPDSLLEVLFVGDEESSPVIFEVENTPNRDADRQLLEDILLVRLHQGVFPDAVLILLSPRGRADVDGEKLIESRGKTVMGAVRWHVIRMWELEAEDLFALNDPGLIPWIPLTRTRQPPEEFLRRCRAQIDRMIPPKDQEPFLVATSLFASIRYNDSEVLQRIFSGEQPMIEFPLLNYFEQQIKAKLTPEIEARVKATLAPEIAAELKPSLRCETIRDTITGFLAPISPEILAELSSRLAEITDEAKLQSLAKTAAQSDAATFLKLLSTL